MTNFDGDAYLAEHYDLKALASSAEYRRLVCRLDPLAFSLVYFRDSLRSDATGNQITLSQFHIDAANSAVRWAKRNIGPKEIREAWVAPRESGKSTWLFLILPAWALAYGHRKYVMAFADNADLAVNHLATFKRKIMDSKSLLFRDFRDLGNPMRRAGGQSDSDRQNMYLSRNGSAFMAKGIESTALGSKVGDQRPDLILFDDIEPAATNYSMHQKEGRLATVRDALLPMNTNAVVQFVGTVTMDGSIMHDIVRQVIETGETAPEWVVAENIKTRYYPALVNQPDGSEVSMWAARWSTEFLKRERQISPRSYALNMDNQPVSLDSAYWTSGMFCYQAVEGLTKHIISIDPAVTTKTSSDYTGIAILSWSDLEQRVVLHRAEQVKLTPSELRLHIIRLIETYGSRMVLVESNQGGDTWKSVFHDLPDGVALVDIKQSVKKESRWAASLDYWSRKWVVHDPEGSTGPFERQALSVPKSANDDIVDAVVSGVAWMITNFRNNRKGQRRDRSTTYV